MIASNQVEIEQNNLYRVNQRYSFLSYYFRKIQRNVKYRSSRWKYLKSSVFVKFDLQIQRHTSKVILLLLMIFDIEIELI